MVIDCQDCTMKDLACSDCVVSLLLGPVDLKADHGVLGVLADAGLVPPRVPADLVPWNTFVRGGIPPAPFCSPSLASIIAAREPDSSRKELYFIAIPGGGGTVDYSTTLAEHLRKARAYGFHP